MAATKPILQYLVVGLGGAVGSMIRFGASKFLARLKPENPFLAVATVNVIGSLLIGLIAGYITDKSSPAYLLLAVGILGGFTTFSSYSLDLLNMVQKGQTSQAFLYAISQVILGLVAAGIGFTITSKFP